MQKDIQYNFNEHAFDTILVLDNMNIRLAFPVKLEKFVLCTKMIFFSQ